jgi:hypothetical protein
MNDASNGVLVALVAVLVLVVVFTVGVVVHVNKVVSNCQNYGKFTAEGKLYKCEEVGVAK